MNADDPNRELLPLSHVKLSISPSERTIVLYLQAATESVVREFECYLTPDEAIELQQQLLGAAEAVTGDASSRNDSHRP